MNEHLLGHGSISINPIYRSLRKLFKPKLVRGTGFDWVKGYDVRDTIGPISIKDQGSNDGCSGYAGSYFDEIQQRIKNITQGQISAKSIYCPIAYVGGGTTVPSFQTQMCAKGSNLEEAVPSVDALGNPLTEAMMIEKSWVTPLLTADALTRAGYTPFDVGTNIDDVAAAIEAYGAVIWEIQGQNNGTWRSPNPLAPQSNNPSPIWAHFMCVIGAKMINGQKTLIALQSWGPSVGDAGIQYFTEDYLNSGYIVDVFTFISDVHIVSLPLAMQMPWQSLVLFFHQLWKK